MKVLNFAIIINIPFFFLDCHCPAHSLSFFSPIFLHSQSSALWKVNSVNSLLLRWYMCIANNDWCWLCKVNKCSEAKNKLFWMFTLNVKIPRKEYLDCERNCWSNTHFKSLIFYRVSDISTVNCTCNLCIYISSLKSKYTT